MVSIKFNRNTLNKILGQVNVSLPFSNELTPKQEDQLEQNLTWIFASPRSGTSWLANQLMTYNTHNMDEPYIGHHLTSIGITENNFKLTESHKKRNAYFFSEKYKNTWQVFLRKLILNRIYAQFKCTDGKIVIKEPNGGFGVDNVFICVPLSKMILVLRDGRDVIDSLVDARMKGSWGIELDEKSVNSNNRINFIRNHARWWVIRTNLLLKTFDERPKDLRFKIKYEDLRYNTFEELKKIYDFIGIKIPEKKLEQIVEKYSFENIPSEKKGSGKVTRSASPGKWKENFSEEEQRIMSEVMSETLSQLGYK